MAKYGTAPRQFGTTRWTILVFLLMHFLCSLTYARFALRFQSFISPNDNQKETVVVSTWKRCTFIFVTLFLYISGICSLFHTGYSFGVILFLATFLSAMVTIIVPVSRFSLLAAFPWILLPINLALCFLSFISLGLTVFLPPNSKRSRPLSLQPFKVHSTAFPNMTQQQFIKSTLASLLLLLLCLSFTIIHVRSVYGNLPDQSANTSVSKDFQEMLQLTSQAQVNLLLLLGLATLIIGVCGLFFDKSLLTWTSVLLIVCAASFSLDKLVGESWYRWISLPGSIFFLLILSLCSCLHVIIGDELKRANTVNLNLPPPPLLTTPDISPRVQLSPQSSPNQSKPPSLLNGLKSTGRVIFSSSKSNRQSFTSTIKSDIKKELSLRSNNTSSHKRSKL